MSARYLACVAASAVVVAASLTVPLSGANGNFVPDWTFKGSALTGWQKLGAADWRAENGEIIGTPTSADGGWLVLNQSFQDVQVATSLRCSAACKVGILLRAEKTPDGTKGILVSYTPGDIAAYAVTLDAQGHELMREKIRPGGGQARFVANADGTQPNAPPRAGAPARGPAAAAAPGAGGGRVGAARGARGWEGAAGGGGRGRPGMPEGYTNPYTTPTFEFKAADWNDVEVEVEANILRGWLNGGPEAGAANGAADEELGRYGPVALYVGGTGDVRFKDLALKDLGRRVLPTEKVSPNYKMLRLSNFYYSWSASTADINRDGILDVVAGPVYFLGPDFTVMREIALSQTVNPSNTYDSAMVHYAYDWTGDGWPDVLIGTTLYVNPGKELRRWDRIPTGILPGGEISAYKDIDGDGKIDVVNSSAVGVSYSHPDPANPLGPWISVNVSGPGPWPGHGVGAGDLNGDDKMDILNPYGWWEQPAGGAAQTPWKYHVAKLADWPRAGGGPGGAEMVVFDVNGDGKNDIVTSLGGHGFGLGVVRADAQRGWGDFIRRAPDHGRLQREESRQRDVLGASRPDRRRHGWRRHPGHRRRQALLVARGKLRRSGSDGPARALHFSHQAQPEGARRRGIRTQLCTIAPGRDRRFASRTLIKTARWTS